MKAQPLQMLNAADLELLRQHMKRVSYPRGAVLIQEGVYRRALLIVRSGSIRVERLLQGRPIVLAQLGPGEVLGDIGFAEDRAASASIVAQEACEVDAIEGDAMQSLIAAEPGLAARFYHSLAISLAQRVRAGDAARIAAAAGGAGGPGETWPRSRTGNISVRQIPAELGDALESFEHTMLASKQALRSGAPPDTEAARVGAACDAVVALLRTYTRGDALVDIGYSDLLAFRDPGQIEAGVGDFIFRETYATFMLSATMARCHAKPRGFPDDAETMAAIYRDEAEGDDWLGPLIDRWFLSRPLCRSRRAGVQHVLSVLEEMAAAARGGAGPAAELRVASLASGCAAELFAFFERHPGANAVATCVDLDEQALVAGARRAEGLRLGERMSFLFGNAVPSEAARLSLGPHHLVYALGLCEYLADEQVVAMLDLAHQTLLPGGRLIVTNLAPGHADEELMGNLLHWHAHHRGIAEMRALFERSRFAGQPLGLDLDEARVSLIASCRKAA
ncbi:MAG: cyclic nucleotide-binding domain-containing protein [Rubrivivax sp.]|nr:cyclic nucleotide-binding domain-containing protein [Rubrivivax sp.]